MMIDLNLQTVRHSDWINTIFIIEMAMKACTLMAPGNLELCVSITIDAFCISIWKLTTVQFLASLIKNLLCDVYRYDSF